LLYPGVSYARGLLYPGVSYARGLLYPGVSYARAFAAMDRIDVLG